MLVDQASNLHAGPIRSSGVNVIFALRLTLAHSLYFPCADMLKEASPNKLQWLNLAQQTKTNLNLTTLCRDPGHGTWRPAHGRLRDGRCLS